MEKSSIYEFLVETQVNSVGVFESILLPCTLTLLCHDRHLTGPANSLPFDKSFMACSAALKFLSI